MFAHAVGAAQVAAVGDRNADIIHDAAKRIDKLRLSGHPFSIGENNSQKKPALTGSYIWLARLSDVGLVRQRLQPGVKGIALAAALLPRTNRRVISSSNPGSVLI